MNTPAPDCLPGHRMVKLRKCCRCRTVYPEDETVKRTHKKFSGATEDVSPQCGASSYYLHHAGEKKAPRPEEYRASPWPMPTPEPEPAPKAGVVFVNAFALTQRPGGKIWLQHQSGEGMMTDAAKLEKHLLAFWNKEF